MAWYARDQNFHSQEKGIVKAEVVGWLAVNAAVVLDDVVVVGGGGDDGVLMIPVPFWFPLSLHVPSIPASTSSEE